MTSKAVYRLFNGVFLALNCRILNNLFCVTAKGCMCQGLYVPFASSHVDLRAIIKLISVSCELISVSCELRADPLFCCQSKVNRLICFSFRVRHLSFSSDA